MTKQSKVIVPEHVAQEVEKEAQKSIQEENTSEVDQAFVSSEERVLDPTLLEKSLLDRMPQPTGWRLLILPYKGRGVSQSRSKGFHQTFLYLYSRAVPF